MDKLKKRNNRKICFISGAGHSGSTLLGLILGSHTDCFYTGEAIKTKFLNNESRETEEKTCKICGLSCPVWSRFDANSTIDLYEQVSQITNKPIVIDSTKNINWLQFQIEELENKNLDLYLIFIQRDGRAVINSRIRKYPEQEIQEIINQWVDQIKLTKNLYQNFSGKKIKIHYEDLASNPEPLIQNICGFLDIPYEFGMINYFLHEQHPLGGNSGTQYLLIKANTKVEKNSLIHLTDRNKYYYANHPLRIRLDLRWKKELNFQNEQLFEKLAGDLNQEFKWDISA